MISPWQKMSVVEFADFEQRLGQKICRTNDVYWSAIRPFFYRPILPFCEYPKGSLVAPLGTVLGGFQYAVPRTEQGNSFLTILAFDTIEPYSIDCLDYNRKRQVKTAQKHFTVRPIESAREFREKAYGTYLSFYQRTRYVYKAERRHRPEFNRWADLLFRFPKIVILGGFQAQELRAVTISMMVEDTIMYATFFCDTEGLRLNIADLMLHTVREMAVNCHEAHQIFVGMYKGEKGQDGFYLLRGCKTIRKPAFFHCNPVSLSFLRYCMPQQYAKLCGNFDDLPRVA
jgi:hypothetical protein